MAPDVETRPSEAQAEARSNFAIGLGVIVLIGVIARLVYILAIVPDHNLFQDSSWYHLQSLNLRDGRGYIDIARQYAALQGHPELRAIRSTAYWPPLYPGFLAGFHVPFGDSVRVSQLTGCVTGAATIVVTGLLGRAIGGKTLGLLGAALVAGSPFLIAADGSLMSETLYLPLALLALLLAYHARINPRLRTWCALGAVIGLATLARGDALLLVLVAMVPAAVLARVPAREIIPRVLVGLGVTALVLAPWVIRNAVEVDAPTVSTISANGVLAASNCAQTYHGTGLGSWNRPCMDAARSYRMSEADYADFLRDKGLTYAIHHVDRWPMVAAARVGRVFGVWDPVDLTRRSAQESRNRSWEWLSWSTSLLVLGIGLVGFWILAKQHRKIATLVAPVVMTLLIALLTYGNARFRIVAEPALLIGVAAALLAAYSRVRSRSSGPEVAASLPS